MSLLYLIGLFFSGHLVSWVVEEPATYTCACVHAHTFHFTTGNFSAVGAFHSNQRAERPFPEEDPGSDGDGFLKQELPPPPQLEGLKHFLHQVRKGPLIPPYFLLPSSFSLPTLGVQGSGFISLLGLILCPSFLLSQSNSYLVSPFWNLGDQP